MTTIKPLILTVPTAGHEIMVNVTYCFFFSRGWNLLSVIVLETKQSMRRAYCPPDRDAPDR
jgi:hypothetical protein